MKQPARQVHLDFHTSEDIPGVGSLFDKGQFQEALCAGRVNAINIFAKCHHGWSYYPTKVGRVHPTLSRNLLGEEIEACHEMGVRCPIYYTVGWSANDAREHPEWMAIKKDGAPAVCNVDFAARPEDPRPYTSWVHLCVSGGYLDLILRQTEEICESFDVDGMWYDICFFEPPCHCPECLAGMRREGLDPQSDADAAEYKKRKWLRFQRATREIVHARRPEATLFYNGGASQYAPQWHEGQTHFELEDLPSSWGGYDKFPARAKYFANKGKDIIAMSGKFHTSWGEFGGFKHPDALRLEAAAMLAFGARCCFGDQMHPSGRMDMGTYERIGEAYRYAEQVEEYGLDGRHCARLGLWLSGEWPDDQGVVNMLLETQQDFEVVAPEGGLSRFETIVLGGARCLDESSAARLNEYVNRGGSLVVLGESGLDREGKRFLLDVGARYEGPARFENDYTVVGDALSEEMVRSPFLNLHAALRATLTSGERLAGLHEAVFDRTYGHYCSHCNSPWQVEEAAHPAAWREGRVVYLAHRLARMYHEGGMRLHRQLFRNALGLVYGRPALSVRMPSGGRVNLTHQPDRRRYVAHLLYAPPMQRGRLLVIEDMPALRDVPVTLDVPEKAARAYLAASKKPLAIARDGSKASVIVDSIEGHQAVVFEY